MTDDQILPDFVLESSFQLQGIVELRGSNLHLEMKKREEFTNNIINNIKIAKF